MLANMFRSQTPLDACLRSLKRSDSSPSFRNRDESFSNASSRRGLMESSSSSAIATNNNNQSQGRQHAQTQNNRQRSLNIEHSSRVGTIANQPETTAKTDGSNNKFLSYTTSFSANHQNSIKNQQAQQNNLNQTQTNNNNNNSNNFLNQSGCRAVVPHVPNGPPVPYRRMLRHQNSLNNDEQHGMLSKSSSGDTTSNNSYQKQSSQSSALGENDGPVDESAETPSTTTTDRQQLQNQLSTTASISNSRESNLNLTNYDHNQQHRPPAIRSNSSASSLYATFNSQYNSSTSPIKSTLSANPNLRQRRGAMVSCENLLADSSELFSQGSESTLKNWKNSKKISGIFSNPFKSDTEKMEQLTELLKQYAENGIPDPKHLLVNKLNHIRASSLSITGLMSSNGNHPIATTPNTPSSANPTTLLSTTRTSLSTTDLHRLNHSNNGPLILSTPQQQSQPGPIMPSTSFDATAVDSCYYLEPEWRCIVDNADQLPAHVQSQYEAIWELLRTEVSYIRNLKVINDVFIACLLNLRNEGLLIEIEPKSVFSNIGEVYEANDQFWMQYLLPMLNYSREKKAFNPTMFEEGFLQCDRIFRPYIQCCLEHEKCLKELREKRKSNPLFKTYILWCENHKDCERLELKDLLVKPMQRITKYPLLLKAILKKTDNEAHKESLIRMEQCVERFVFGVNTSMSRQQEHERLSAVVTRIESYDAIDCTNDEAEKFLKDYLYLDLMQSMPGCAPHKIRRLYMEDTVKLKDSSTNKQDVHCFLFTDVFLVCKPLNKKSSDSRMKVIRQPFITDRLVVRELKDSIGLLLIYLNELNVASTYMLLFTSDSRSWVDNIKKAQEDYRNLKYSSENQSITYQNSYDDGIYANDPHYSTMFATSPRSSSRSSLIHSHSGSQDINEAQQHLPGSQRASTTSSNQLSIQQHSPRAISFELGDLRNPSLVVEDADSFARSQSFDTRSPMVTITSPRHDRRAYLLRNQPGKTNQTKPNAECNNSTNYLNQNSLSVNVPYIQTVNTVPVQQRSGPGRRSVPNISNASGNTITLNETNYMPNPTGQSNNAATIQVAVHPPPASPSPPPPSPAKRSPSHKTTGRPLPPLPPQTSAPNPPPPSPPPPPSLMSISSRGVPNPMTMTINKPPLIKTKNVSYGVASMSYAPDKAPPLPSHAFSLDDHKMDDNKNNPMNIQVTTNASQDDKSVPKAIVCEQDMNDDEEEESDDSKNPRCNSYQQQKRTYRPDRRYHTADSIEHLKKEKDNSIHKRLSWNYGQQQQQQQQQSSNYHAHTGCVHYVPHHCCSASTGHHCSSGTSNQLLQPRSLASTHHPNKCLSTESVCSSSGFSSTGSVPLSVGSAMDNTCDQSCCACCAGLDLHKLQLQEEEEDDENLKRDPSRKTSQCSDRDSALPISPALNDVSSTSPVCYHEHSNSQCSVEGCNAIGPGLSTNIDDNGTKVKSIMVTDSPDIKIDVREMKDGISSVQITLGPNTVSRPSIADLKKMKDFLLSNCNMESSEV